LIATLFHLFFRAGENRVKRGSTGIASLGQFSAKTPLPESAKRIMSPMRAGFSLPIQFEIDGLFHPDFHGPAVLFCRSKPPAGNGVQDGF
jgi:hypothetical protein